jgi:hypothetical protein
MSLDDQEKVWQLSRTCDVFEQDANGVLWQVLDLTVDDASAIILNLRAGDVRIVVRDHKGDESEQGKTGTEEEKG